MSLPGALHRSPPKAVVPGADMNALAARVAARALT